MKTKRIIALLLLLVMLFALAACGGRKPSVVGLWEAEVDMRDQMVEQLDASVGGSKSFGDYLDSFVWVLTLELKENGTYTLGYNIDRDMAAIKAAVVDYMRDMINEQVGMEVSDELIDAMTDAAESESGVYQNKDGKLIWPDGEESPYVLTEDTLGFAVKALGELSFTRIG